MMVNNSCLAGMVVLERGDRLATALCGALLAELGATVVRCELTAPQWPGLSATAQAQALNTARAGKINLTDHADEAWRTLHERADAILFSPVNASDRRLARSAAHQRVVCAITAFGLDAKDAPHAGPCTEWEMQSLTGVMAVTGRRNEGPEAVQFPLLEMMAAINAATATAAALLRMERSGVPQLLDQAVFDAGVAMMGTFLPSVQDGKRGSYRMGAGNHLSAPWNAYRTRTGWMQLCTFSNAEWTRVLQIIGRGDLETDERFKTVTDRVAHAADVDRIVEDWTCQHSTAEAVELLSSGGAAAGAIKTVPEVLIEPLARDRSLLPTGKDGHVPGSFFRFSRATTVYRHSEECRDSVQSLLQRLGPRRAVPVSADVAKPSLPLAGIRVLEVGPYTAGPLTGRYLCALGAEVIKIEPYEGEVSREMKPVFGGWSGYFINMNAGKKFLSLDLRQDTDRAAFLKLAQGADVLLTNLKPGSLDRLDVGPKVLATLAPRLVICNITGFGADGGKRAALDTVIQGEAGVMSLVGDGSSPNRVGVSVADQSAAHVAPLAVIAALRYRDQTGLGQLIDLAMHDVSAWLTHLNWPDGQPALKPWQMVAVSDGWICAEIRAESSPQILAGIAGPMPWAMNRAQALELLRARGIACTPVLDVEEVFAQETVRRRSLVLEARFANASVHLLRAPHRFGKKVARLQRPCAAADADRQELLP